jgi:hypothetical protein
MDRPKLFRRFRITFAAICLLFCVAFVVLWVRSYQWQDYAHCPLPGESINPSSRRLVQLRDGTQFEPSPRMLILNSFKGRLSLYAGERHAFRTGYFPWGWGMESTSAANFSPQRNNRPRPSWVYTTDRYGRYVLFPHWAPALVFAVLAAVLGVRWPYQFSVRTLLIIITIVAAILGLVVAT